MKFVVIYYHFVCSKLEQSHPCEMSSKKRGDNVSELEINFPVESIKSRKNVIEKKTDNSVERFKLLAIRSVPSKKEV
uniref:Uncharacterized protein n=1 Tax=Romanomermis culicivorax TaxID=13658 RepID=A0A915JZW9_ROMCU